MAQDIRWEQRLVNFERAVVLLREPIQRGIESLSDLEKEGAVQRFEFTVELAWKTLKDYLEYQGRVFEPVTPRHVLKEAYAAKILPDGQVWMDMLDHRNLLSHTYDAKTFRTALEVIRDRYHPALEALHAWLSEQKQEA